MQPVLTLAVLSLALLTLTLTLILRTLTLTLLTLTALTQAPAELFSLLVWTCQTTERKKKEPILLTASAKIVLLVVGLAPTGSARRMLRSYPPWPQRQGPTYVGESRASKISEPYGGYTVPGEVSSESEPLGGMAGGTEETGGHAGKCWARA